MQSFQTDGYYVARNLLDAVQVERVLGNIHLLISNQIKPKRSGILSDDLETLRLKNSQTYFNTLKLSGQIWSLYNLLTAKRIRKICQKLRIKFPAFQTKPEVHALSAKLEPSSSVVAHQEFTSTLASINGIVVWIPFTDTTLEIIPGSHTSLRSTKCSAKCSANDNEFTRVDIKKGDVLFLSVIAVYRACIPSNGLSLSASMVYEDAAEKTFIAAGYPHK